MAWRADDPQLLLIECKRLQPARTIGEISELLKQFRGEAGDRLVTDPDGHVLRLGADLRPGEPPGEWLDADGRRWLPAVGRELAGSDVMGQTVMLAAHPALLARH